MFSFRTECTIVLKLPEGKSSVEASPTQGAPPPQEEPLSQVVSAPQGELPSQDTSLPTANSQQVHILDTPSDTQSSSLAQILPESSTTSSATSTPSSVNSASIVVVSSSTPAQPPSASVLFSVSPCQPPSSATSSSTSTTSSSSSHEVVVISGNTISIPLSTPSIASSPSDPIASTSSALTSSSASTTASSPNPALVSHSTSLLETPVSSSSASSPSPSSSSIPLISSSFSLPTSASSASSEVSEGREVTDLSSPSSGVRRCPSPPPSPSAESTRVPATSSSPSPQPVSEPLVKLTPEPSMASLETNDAEFTKGSSSSVLSSATITISTSGSPSAARPTLSMSPVSPSPVPAILSSNAIYTPTHMSSPTPSSTSSPTSEISSAAFVSSFPDHQISSSSDTPGVSSSSPTASTLTNTSDATPLVSPVVSPLPLDGSAPPPLPVKNASSTFLNASPNVFADSSFTAHVGASSEFPTPGTSSGEMMAPMSETCGSAYVSACSSLPVVLEESINGSDSSAEGGHSPPPGAKSELVAIEASGKCGGPATKASGSPDSALNEDKGPSHDSGSEIRNGQNTLTSEVSNASASPLPASGLKSSSSNAPPIPPKKTVAPPRPPKDVTPSDSSGMVPGPAELPSAPVPRADGEVGKIIPAGNEPQKPDEPSTSSSAVLPAVLSSSSSSISTTSSTITTSTTSCFATITTTVTTNNVAPPQHSSSASPSTSSPRPSLPLKAEAKRPTTAPTKKENALDKGKRLR